jgi:hypothetical protein
MCSSTELFLQAMPFGNKEAQSLLTAFFEAMYICLLANKACEANLTQWTETLVEAYFLQNTVFAGAEEVDAETDDYMLDLLDRIQKLINREQAQIESAASLAGQLDSIQEQSELLKAKISVREASFKTESEEVTREHVHL